MQQANPLTTAQRATMRALFAKDGFSTLSAAAVALGMSEHAAESTLRLSGFLVAAGLVS